MIEWDEKEGRIQQYGRVSGVHLYTIRSSYAHGDLAKTHPWGLDHKLPFAPARKAFATPEEARQYAERHLQAAMLRLGFVKRVIG